MRHCGLCGETEACGATGFGPWGGRGGAERDPGWAPGLRFPLKRSLELQEAAHGRPLPATSLSSGWGHGVGHGVPLSDPSPAAPQAGECGDAFSTFDVPIFTEEFLDQNKGVGLGKGLSSGWGSLSPSDPALSLQPGRPSCGACGR